MMLQSGRFCERRIRIGALARSPEVAFSLIALRAEMGRLLETRDFDDLK
jgi:hypothetical protein